MGESDPAVTGMAMQYAFQVIWGLAFFVMNVTDVEAQAVSLERIHKRSQSSNHFHHQHGPKRVRLNGSAWACAIGKASHLRYGTSPA